jgi:hypothetical protein
MLDRDEIVQSLTGAWRLFLDRPDAMRYFDVSVDGFWRSFAAVVLIAPAYILFAALERTEILAEPIIDPAFSDGAFFANKVLTLALDWVALPLLLALVAGPLGVGRAYASFVVARNWCAVLATAPFGLVALLSLLGFLGAGPANFISLLILVVIIRYNFIIARRALGADIGLAVGVVVADLAISFALIALVDGVISYHSTAL